MKSKLILIITALLLISCGGDNCDKEDWEIDVELCEAQGGRPELLHVIVESTGETYIDVKCVFEDEK